MVVSNRLEQLRRRQRDEALMAQRELLAGTTKNTARPWGGDLRAEAIAQPVEVPPTEVEEVEPYDRSMSPDLLDIKRLPYDDRQIRVVQEKDDIQALVSTGFAKHVIRKMVCYLICPVRSTSQCRRFPIYSQTNHGDGRATRV